MTRIFITLLLVFSLVGCMEKKTAPTAPREQKDPKVAALEERIAKVTPEGKATVEKVKGMKPEVNSQASAKTLGEIVEDYASNKGAYNLSQIGWEADSKSNGRWKVIFHYKTYSGDLSAAEWEYDPAAGKLYPFETKNAPIFWTGEGAKKGDDPKAK